MGPTKFTGSVCSTVLACCAMVAASLGQTTTTPVDRPGYVFRGRYIGFVPSHERLRATLTSEPLSDTVSQSAGDSSAATDAIAAPDGDVWLQSDVGAAADGVSCDAGGALPWCAAAAEPLIWGRADYLLWWTKGMDPPPLATTSDSGTAQSNAGVLGDFRTSILFGATELNSSARSGGRVTLGRWFDPTACSGFDVTFLWLAEGSDSFSASGDDSSILARPFFNAQTGAEDSRLIVFPNLVEGTLAVTTATDFRSWEAVLRHALSAMPGCQTDYSIGYRYAELQDRLRVDEHTVSLTTPTLGTRFDLSDEFTAENCFHGGEFGIRVRRQRDACWSIELTAQVALGNTSSTVTAVGQTETTPAQGNAQQTDSGLLVQSTNRGTIDRDQFSTLSQAGLTLRRQFNERLAARFGYDFLYWSNVMRAGRQVDLAVNPTQIPPGTLVGTARPAMPLEADGFWAQGLQFGIDYRY